jgi:predicted  nucleic acid-binding Zn-ribbon protein
VNEQIGLLVELQKLDSTIISLSRSIKAIPNKISSMEKPLKEAQANLRARKQGLEAAEKKKRDKEREVEEIDEKVEKMKARTADIKDNKAYQAHLKEIEKAEKTRFAREDEILELMESLDQEGGKVKEAEGALEGENRKVEELKAALDAEVGEGEKELSALKGKRTAMVDSLEKEIYDKYMSLLTNLGGLAVTKVEGEVCTGCNMHIMPQLYVEIKKNETIITCPQCNRILYFEQPEEQPAE